VIAHTRSSIWEQHPARDRYQPEVFRAVDRVIFLIGAENYRSQRAVEKIGATPAGTRIDGYGRERLAFEITAAVFDGSS